MIPLITAASVAFWFCSPIMVIAAISLVCLRKPVYSALCLGLIMVCLAIQYAALNAPFLFVVQIIVYMGAVLMLFLFVLMLVGVDTKDSFVETIKGQRWSAFFATLGFAMLLIFGIGHAIVSPAAKPLNGAENVSGLADLLFTRYVFAFEITSALLITAAIAAMVLAHGEKIRKKARQPQKAAQRIRDYAQKGIHPGPMPSSGVFANHNSIATPALLPDGAVAELSVSKALAERGAILEGNLAAPTASVDAMISAAQTEAEGEDE